MPHIFEIDYIGTLFPLTIGASNFPSARIAYKTFNLQ